MLGQLRKVVGGGFSFVDGLGVVDFEGADRFCTWFAAIPVSNKARSNGFAE